MSFQAAIENMCTDECMLFRANFDTIDYQVPRRNERGQATHFLFKYRAMTDVTNSAPRVKVKVGLHLIMLIK